MTARHHSDPATPASQKAQRSTYTAGWNMPGYLPETDPETFDTLEDAAAYLRDTLARWLDEDEAPEDMTAEDILTVDHTAHYADGWYTPNAGGAEMHLWATRAQDSHTDLGCGCGCDRFSDTGAMEDDGR